MRRRRRSPSEYCSRICTMPPAKKGSQLRQAPDNEHWIARSGVATRRVSAAASGSSGENAGSTPSAAAPGAAIIGGKRSRRASAPNQKASVASLRSRAPQSAAEAVGRVLRSRASPAAGSSSGQHNIAAAAVARGNSKRKANHESNVSAAQLHSAFLLSPK